MTEVTVTTETPEAKLQRIRDKLLTIEAQIAEVRGILKGNNPLDKNPKERAVQKGPEA